MNIFGIDIIGAVTNPTGIITTAASGLIVHQVWKAVNSVIKPVQYVEYLYDAADKIIERLDDNVIDRIRSKKIKSEIQKELKSVLSNRSNKINILINKIAD